MAGDRGIQQVRATLQGESGRFTVIVVHRLAYVRGTTFALHALLDFTAAESARYDGRWISVPPGNAKYKDLAPSPTLPSFLHDIFPTAPLSLIKTTVAGRKVTGLRGVNREPGLRFEEALFPDSQHRPLGVSDIDPSRGFVDAIKMSRWNEPVHVTAPAHAVPIATVQAG